MKLNPANSRRGVTKIEVVVTVVVLLILAATLLPAKRKAKRINCVNNLKQVALAFKTWSLDNNDKLPMQVSTTNGGTLELVPIGLAYPHFQVLSNNWTSPRLFICPADKDRIAAVSLGSEFNNKNLSYFVNLDAEDTNGVSFLAGDRNLTLNNVPLKTGLATFAPDSSIGWTGQMHSNWGNILLNDGSVQQWPSSRLNEKLRATDIATNHLAIP